MTANQQTILTCLEINVAKARTKALRKFAEEQLDYFTKHLDKQKQPKRPTPNWDRFIESETV